MDFQYAKQAGLVIKVIPHIATEDIFALKGGTAINLFERDLPQLPAIAWKHKNLQKLKDQNPKKFDDQRKLLAELLERSI